MELVRLQILLKILVDIFFTNVITLLLYIQSLSSFTYAVYHCQLTNLFSYAEFSLSVRQRSVGVLLKGSVTHTGVRLSYFINLTACAE
jgi:hypothetical protein